MIKLVDVTVAFGGQTIMDNVSWMLGDSDRAGLVGENGSGKTTLLKAMAGLQEVDRGKVEYSRGLKIGYLPQQGIAHKGRTLYQEVTKALGELIDLEKQQEQVQERLNDPDLPDGERDELVHRLSDIIDKFASNEGYEIDAKIGRVLNGLGFEEDQWQRPVESFSGGWQMRIALAKLLLEQPDVLLLDEPTNHLDLEARNWLESFLLEYDHSYLIVSHDRYFLDVTIDRVVEVDRGALNDYRGNYSRFLVEKEKRVALQRAAYEKQQEEIQRLQNFINKYRADKKRAGQVHSRMKMLERIEPVAAPSGTKPIRFTFPDPPRGPHELARLEGIHKAYGEKIVLDGVDLQLHRGEKVATVGVNGAGKSTLLSILAGAKKFDAGARDIKDGTHMAFFGQEAAEDFDPDDTVMEALEKGAPFETYPRLRSLLGAFLFSGDDIDKKVSVLSGGEKSRLALARLLLRPANLLILDEPTNHLDLRAKEVLMNAFRDYKGTLVFVAHDRYFLEDLPERVVEVRDRKVNSFPGDYSDYLKAIERLEAGAESARDRGPRANPAPSLAKEDRKPAGKAAPSPPREKPLSEKEKRALERQRRKEKQRLRQKRQNRISAIETEIHRAEDRQAEVEKEMANPGNATNYMKLMDLEVEKKGIEEKIERLMEEWQKLENELERE